MSNLSKKEQKQIQKYCVFPKISRVAIIMSFVLCGLIVVLEMIDDIVFHNKGFQPGGMYTAIALIIVYVSIFCYCILCPKFGMMGKQWKELQIRLKVKQDESDYSGQVAGAVGMQAAGRLLENSSNNTVENVGKAFEIAGAVNTMATAAEMLSQSQRNAEVMANALNAWQDCDTWVTMKNDEVEKILQLFFNLFDLFRKELNNYENYTNSGYNS